MARKQKAKIICDGAIIFISALLALAGGYRGREREAFWILTSAAVICAAAAAADLIVTVTRMGSGRMDAYRHFQKGRQAEPVTTQVTPGPAIHELILLDEQDKPIKSWNIAGKTAVVIGRRNETEEVDVDLEDCEYGTFVDLQHAALNYCLDRWYLEDLGSTNGVRVRKAEDGICYKVTGRPCRVEAGDIVYIARTRLLLT